MNKIVHYHSSPESHMEEHGGPETHITSPEAEQTMLRHDSMSVFQAIYTRRSIRKFLDTPIEFDKIVEVARAGSYAPCAGNLQNWKFVVDTNKDHIRSLYHHTLEQEACMTATAAIVVVAEMDTGEKFYGMRGKRLYAVQNCAAAMQNMLLAAHALGLGAVWIGAFDENRVNDSYKIPSTARTQGIILLGYPDEHPQPRHMKHLWYVMNFHRYGLKYEKPHLIEWDVSDFFAKKQQEWRAASERATKKAGLDKTDEFAAKGKEAMGNVGSQAKKFLASLKKSPKGKR